MLVFFLKLNTTKKTKFEFASLANEHISLVNLSQIEPVVLAHHHLPQIVARYIHAVEVDELGVDDLAVYLHEGHIGVLAVGAVLERGHHQRHSGPLRVRVIERGQHDVVATERDHVERVVPAPDRAHELIVHLIALVVHRQLKVGLLRLRGHASQTARRALYQSF